jgi:hypothetical protein
MVNVLCAKQAYENAVLAKSAIEKNKERLREQVIPYLNHIHQKIRKACKEGLMNTIVQLPRGLSLEMMETLYYILWQDEGFTLPITYWKYRRFKITWEEAFK